MAGWSYLAALAPALFAEFYVRGQVVIADDRLRTLLSVLAHERLFRLGIAANLAVFAIDVVLITALYAVLRSVHPRLALLALGWGLVETTVLVGVTLTDLAALDVLSGGELTSAGRQLAGLAISAHGTVYGVGLVFAGLRSTTFCGLWLRSGLIPWGLAMWGLLASVLMGASALAFIVFPELERQVPVGLYGGPIFLFELTMGCWLLLGFGSARRWSRPEA